MVLVLLAGFGTKVTELEDMGRTLGLSPARRLAWVTLPSVAPTLAAATVLGFLHGTVCDGHLSWGGVALSAPGPDGPATLAIRPDHIELAQDGPLRATVTEAVYTGAHVRLVLLRGDHRLEAHVAPAQAPRAGAEVALELPAQRLWRLPGDGGEVSGASAATSPSA